MAEHPTQDGANTDWLAWAMIALGILASLLALWDLLIERDGSVGGSIAALAIGLVVLGLGIQRRR